MCAMATGMEDLCGRVHAWQVIRRVTNRGFKETTRAERPRCFLKPFFHPMVRKYEVGTLIARNEVIWMGFADDFGGGLCRQEEGID